MDFIINEESVGLSDEEFEERIKVCRDKRYWVKNVLSFLGFLGKSITGLIENNNSLDSTFDSYPVQQSFF